MLTPTRCGRLIAGVFCGALFVLGLAFSLGAAAETRLALVIGNSGYTNYDRLLNAVRDARLLQTSLKQAGFDVSSVENANIVQFRDSINAFTRKVEASGEDAVAFIYFAGHGIQDDELANYLLPIDSHLAGKSDLPDQTYAVNTLLAKLDKAAPKLAMVILDTCRTNPFIRGLEPGIGVIELKRQDILVAFSTSPGSSALDGLGDNSPYAEAFASEMLKPGLLADQVIRHVTAHVLNVTKGRQRPFVSSSLTQDFYFVRGPAEAPSPTRPGGGYAGLDPAKAYDEAVSQGSLFVLKKFQQEYPNYQANVVAVLIRGKEEEEVWKAAESASSLTARKRLYSQIRDEYPDGVYADIAARRIQEIDSPTVRIPALPSHPRVSFTKLDNTDLYGGDIYPSGVRASTFEACAAVCEKNAACSGFTFNARYNVCFPKDGAVQRRPWAQAYSGVADSQNIIYLPEPSGPSFARLNGYDLPGGDLFPKGKSAASATECEQMCRDEGEPRCRAYTFNTQFDRCFLKTDARAQLAWDTAISGVLTSRMPVPMVEGKYLRLASCDIPGNDIYPKGMSVSSVAECETMCRNQIGPACKAYTFNTQFRVCFLKSAVGTQVAYGNAVSGVLEGAVQQGLSSSRNCSK